uniref:Uncharacterized protein n=1 Tax=Glossina austeni TaxID=7395 RepID=A0A1A9UH56_GLOAU
MNFESTLTIANKVSFHYDHHHCHHHHHHYYQSHHYDGLQPQYAIINNDTNLKTIEVSITHINRSASLSPVDRVVDWEITLSGDIEKLPGDVRDDAEVIEGHRRDEDFDDFKGVIDTGVGYTFLRPNPQATAFNFGFYDSFEGKH